MPKDHCSFVDIYKGLRYRKRGSGRRTGVSEKESSNHKYAITLEEHDDFMREYFRVAADMMLETGRDFKLPKGLGRLEIVKYKGHFRKDAMNKYHVLGGFIPRVLWKKRSPNGVRFRYARFYFMKTPASNPYLKDAKPSMKRHYLNRVLEEPHLMYNLRRVHNTVDNG